MTITIDGHLDIWDFEPFKQAIYKDRGVLNQPDIVKQEKRVYNAALDLIGHPSIPNLCMVVTHRSVMGSILKISYIIIIVLRKLIRLLQIFSLQNATFIPHVTIPAQNETGWTGGEFCGKDKFVIYAQVGYLLNRAHGNIGLLFADAFV